MRAPGERSSDEFNIDRDVDISFLVRVSEKSLNRCASDLAIIASKFVHVHADELAGELRVHVPCVWERISDGFLTMCETVVDAFANDLADVTLRWWRDIFAYHISP